MDKPEPVQQKTSWGKFTEFISREANFFRIHVLFFTFLPLICSGIMFASNGEFPLAYIDCLFLCYTSMTVCGLATANLSTITGWQQAILYILMWCGDVTVVSYVMVLVRRHYFRTKCEIVHTSMQMNNPGPRRATRGLSQFISAPVAVFPFRQNVPARSPERDTGVPYRIASNVGGRNVVNTPRFPRRTAQTLPDPRPRTFFELPESDKPQEFSTYGIHIRSPTVEDANADLSQEKSPGSNQMLSDAHSVTSSPRSLPVQFLTPVESRVPRVTTMDPVGENHLRQRARADTRYFPRSATILTSASREGITERPRNQQGLGGFPGPITLTQKLLRRMVPGASNRIERTLTIPAAATLQSVRRLPDRKKTIADGDGAKWLSFDGLFVGRNSDFRTDSLTDEQLAEIGGVEYRALQFLAYLIPIYYIGSQFIGFLIFGPYLISTSKYNFVFEVQPRLVSKAWAGVFSLASAYTGGGLLLVDQGMVPFQQMYSMIIGLGWTMLCGNQCLPIFLRLVIWIGTKCVREGSRADETLHFLLDHPRRCYIYLFPSPQTWFLIATLIVLTAIEWVSFCILDIGLEIVDSLPVGTRIIDGLFQSLAVRASGFAIINVSALAPAVQFLYVVMMYIAIYPVAMSIRSTNVYEEKSLGVFKLPEVGDDEPELQGERRERIAKYLGWHVRRQLAYDIWWLIWGIWLICIIERSSLLNEAEPWFNIFHVIFDLVSAFAGIGVSLGFPDNNYSFCGTFSPLAKLVVIVIMLRGRHRALPVAIDRAIMLPSEFAASKRPEGSGGPKTDNAVPAQGQPEEETAV